MKVTFFIAWWKMKGSGTKCIVAFFCNQKLKSGKRKKKREKRSEIIMVIALLLTNKHCVFSVTKCAYQQIFKVEVEFFNPKILSQQNLKILNFLSKIKIPKLYKKKWRIFKHKLCKNLEVKKVWIFTLKILIEVRCMSLFIRQ